MTAELILVLIIVAVSGYAVLATVVTRSNLLSVITTTCWTRRHRQQDDASSRDQKRILTTLPISRRETADTRTSAATRALPSWGGVYPEPSRARRTLNERLVRKSSGQRQQASSNRSALLPSRECGSAERMIAKPGRVREPVDWFERRPNQGPCGCLSEARRAHQATSCSTTSSANRRATVRSNSRVSPSPPSTACPQQSPTKEPSDHASATSSASEVRFLR